MNKAVFLSLAIVSLFSVIATAQQKSAAEMNPKMEFLIGDWRCESTFVATGQKVQGDLSYHWVIGGEWVLCRFVGEHPDRAYWEAVAMMRWDEKGQKYVSVDFFNAEMPSTMYGEFIDDKTLRFSATDENGSHGIDYIDNGDGTVFQRNWRQPKGEEAVDTLHTTYAPVQK